MNLWWRLALRWARLKRTSPCSLWDTVDSTFRVVPTDLDVLGHMNNGRYLTLMDLGRYELLKRSGWWEESARRGWFAVVGGQTVTYRKELRVGQRFTLTTRVLGFDDRWCYLEQRFMVGETLHAFAIVRTRFLKRTGGSVPLDEIEEAVGGFPADKRVAPWVREWTHQTRVPSSPS